MTVVTITIHPAISLNTPMYGTNKVPPIKANPTARETIIPTIQAITLTSDEPAMFFAIFFKNYYSLTSGGI